MTMRNSRVRFGHRFAEKNLSAYSDDEVTEGEKKRIERHLARCLACREELASLRATTRLLAHSPILRVPRSFALPVSAQEAQTGFRRWDAAFGAFRAASVAISFVLVLLLSANYVLEPEPARTFAVQEEKAALSIVEPTPAPQRTIQVTREVEKEVVVRAVTEQEQPLADAAQPAAEARPTSPPAPLPTPAPREAVASAPDAAPLAASDAAVEKVKMAKGASAAPEGEVPRVPASGGGAAEELAASETGRPELGPVEETVEEAQGVPTTETARPSATIFPTAVPVPPTSTPAPLPTEDKRVARRTVDHPTQAPPDRRGQPGSRSPLSILWMVIPAISGVLLGLLLIVVAAMLWTGWKRRT